MQYGICTFLLNESLLIGFDFCAHRCINKHHFPGIGGGMVDSRLVCSSPDWAVWVQTLAGDIALCSWARHLSQVYRWVPAILVLWEILQCTSIPSRGEQKYSKLLHTTKQGYAPAWWPACRLSLLSQAMTWNPQGKTKRGQLRNGWRRDTESELKRSGKTWAKAERTAQS